MFSARHQVNLLRPTCTHVIPLSTKCLWTMGKGHLDRVGSGMWTSNSRRDGMIVSLQPPHVGRDGVKRTSPNLVDVSSASYACQLVIRPDLTKEIPDRTSWYDMWAAAIAVRTLCLEPRRAGQAIDIGKLYRDYKFIAIVYQVLACPVACYRLCFKKSLIMLCDRQDFKNR